MKKNYIPESMSFAEGFLGCSWRNKDYDMRYNNAKAKKIINKLLDEGRNISHADVGLNGDWWENSDTLYSNGKFHKVDFWKNSCWAEPILMVYFTDAPSECYEVYIKKGQNK